MQNGKVDCLQGTECYWTEPAKSVCADCVADAFLKAEIGKNLTTNTCDYCTRTAKEKIAAPLSLIMPYIAKALCYRYLPADEAGLPPEVNFEELPCTRDVLQGIPFNPARPELLDDAAASFWHSRWVENGPGFYGYKSSMLFSWGTFASKVAGMVMHPERFFSVLSDNGSRRRFTFDLIPREMLGKISGVITEMEMTTTWRAGKILYRTRPQEKGETLALDDPAALGPPPDKDATNQRMSPVGISYFYLANERGTSLAETFRSPCRAVVATFSLRRDLRLLDLTKLPAVSVFNPNTRQKYEQYGFLAEFADRISWPIEKDGREHIDEYVPTQVLSEYFAKVYRQTDGTPIDGMIYKSAVHPGGRNIVLFPPQRGKFMDLVKLEGTPKVLDLQHWDDFFRELKKMSS